MYGIGRGSRRIMKYEEARSQMFLAIIIDVTVIFSAFNLFFALINSFVGEKVISEEFLYRGQGMWVSIIIGVVIAFYGLYLNNKVLFLSIGERMTGRHVVLGKKMWINPYKINRLMLYVLLGFNLFVVANYFRGVPVLFSFTQYLRELITMFIHLYTLVKIGSGRINYIFVTIFLYVVSTIFSVNRVNSSDFIIVVGIMIAIICLHILGRILYRKREDSF